MKEPQPLNKAPYYAFPFQGGITATFGGPKINANAQVINNEGRVIPGLYAVGNAAGGLFYGNYIGGTQLGAQRSSEESPPERWPLSIKTTDKGI